MERGGERRGGESWYDSDGGGGCGDRVYVKLGGISGF